MLYLNLQISPIQVIKPHTPLIRFRKNSPYDNENLTSQSTGQTDKSHPLGADTNKPESIMSSSAIEQGKWKSVPVIHEWWDTPLKYKRREIDDHECDIINVSVFFYFYYHKNALPIPLNNIFIHPNL